MRNAYILNHWTCMQTVCEFRCSGKESESSYFLQDTYRVTHIVKSDKSLVDDRVIGKRKKNLREREKINVYLDDSPQNS